MARLTLMMLLSALVPGGTVITSIEGNRLVLDGQPLFLKGINWNPVPKGGQQRHSGEHFRGFVETDSELMAAAGVNALRTYEPIVDVAVLDILWKKGIHVLNTVYISGDSDPNSVIKPVSQLKDHPAILMWVIGNEWNYNMLYSGMDFPAALNRVHEVSTLIKSADPSHPVATVYGMMPVPDQIAALYNVDVWGLTAYTGISFGNLFDLWTDRSEKPMFVAEFGADAYNELAQSEDEVDQATATVALSAEIMARAVQSEGGMCIGGFLFELADEWWKDGNGSPMTQETGGVAPGDGPFPDSVFNEEYWGIVQNDGTPRQAYSAYARVVPPAGSAYRVCKDRMDVSDITDGFRLRACGATPRCRGMLGDCCPNRNGTFHSCCGAASGEAGATSHGDSVDGAEDSRPPPPTSTTPLADLAPWIPNADADDGAGPDTNAAGAQAPALCQTGEAVPCCPDGDCGTCAGDQCCPSNRGSVTCPSASSAIADGCIHPKLYDCTGMTGVHPGPGNTTAAPSVKPKENGAKNPSATTTNTTTHLTTRSTPSSTSTTTPLPSTPGSTSTTTPLPSTTTLSSHGAPIPSVAMHDSIYRPWRLPSPSTTTERHASTEMISFNLHTTMRPAWPKRPLVGRSPGGLPARAPGAWRLGGEKASCDQVCKEAGGCLEGGWPTSADAFSEIVGDLGYNCFHLQEGGVRYDPSTQQGNCGWRYDEAVDSQKTRCAAKAPAFTQRFCPCRSAPTGVEELTVTVRKLAQENEEGVRFGTIFA